jgi:hypothetical protein
MPQFKFSNAHKRADESDEDFARRAAQEEQEGIEAVMTFVLGLVAEPINMRFVHQPKADRHHEVTGLKLLEKYNCVGCHVVKPGSYDLPLNDETKEKLEAILKRTASDMATDFTFPESTAWRSNQLAKGDRLTIRGLPRSAPDEEGRISIEMWDAVQFKGSNGETVNVPAGQGPVVLSLQNQTNAPYGGLYTSIHTAILAKMESLSPVGDRTKLMSSAPPPLIREGQKVQPAWLHQFLLNTHAIRPAVARHLRMPQFNYSAEEAQALVNYFIAVDRLQNPAIGLDYFEQRPDQFDPLAQERSRQAFMAHIRNSGLAPEELAKADYYEYGWKLLVNRELCLKCHDMGTYKAEGELIAKGPPLNMTPERVRPDYFLRWVANPKRTVPYTGMPQYFFNSPHAATSPSPAALRLSVGAAQLGAALSNPFGVPVHAPPGLPLPDQAYNALRPDFALTPLERLKAVRDAVMSWGALLNPPPTARAAGPRPDAHAGESKVGEAKPAETKPGESK